MKFNFDLLVESYIVKFLTENGSLEKAEKESQEQYELRLAKGNTTEKEFEYIMRKNNLNPVKTDSHSDRILKIDYQVYEKKKDEKGKNIKAWKSLPENSSTGTPNTVEVKGNKIKNGKLLVELIGVGYYPGWIFSRANYVSIDLGIKIHFIKLNKLREHLQSLINQRLQSLNLRPDNIQNILNLVDGPNGNKLFPRVSDTSKAVFPFIFRRDDRSLQKGKLDAITYIDWDEVLNKCGSELVFRK